MVVYVRNSIYGETKTDNGVRQLPLVGLLGDLENTLISRWLEHVETFADGDSLATLLPELASQRAIVGHSACVRAVVDVLRTVTGDTHTRLRHLRHTCASRLFLAMVFDEVPRGLLGNIYKRLWGDVKPQDVRMILIGDSRVSRRGLYAIALFMGHGSPDVTHRHYVHLADIVLKWWVRKYSVRMDVKALSYACQTSYGNVRQLRSRSKVEMSTTSMLEFFTRLSTIPFHELRSDIQDGIPISNPPKLAQSFLNPADIDRLLCLATMRNSIDGLAERFLTTSQIVVSALLSAANLQERTGFADFSIPQKKPGDHWVAITLPRYESLEKESSRVRHFLESIGQQTVNVEQLHIASKIWLDTFHPQSTSLLINTRSELNSLLGALKLLGIPNANFEVLIPEDQKEGDQEMWLAIETELSSQGLSVHPPKRLMLSASRFRSDNRVGLILRASKSHPLGYQHTLNRALFITSVWLRLSEQTKIDVVAPAKPPPSA